MSRPNHDDDHFRLTLNGQILFGMIEIQLGSSHPSESGCPRNGFRNVDRNDLKFHGSSFC